MLSQVLKRLERDGIVSRHAYATVPVTVEYALTDLGVTLNAAVAGLTHWAEDTILTAQQAYDQRAQGEHG
jgi:DNA-binding HxlR family transcriptional regulator